MNWCFFKLLFFYLLRIQIIWADAYLVLKIISIYPSSSIKNQKELMMEPYSVFIHPTTNCHIACAESRIVIRVGETETDKPNDDNICRCLDPATLRNTSLVAKSYVISTALTSKNLQPTIYGNSECLPSDTLSNMDTNQNSQLVTENNQVSLQDQLKTTGLYIPRNDWLISHFQAKDMSSRTDVKQIVIHHEGGGRQIKNIEKMKVKANIIRDGHIRDRGFSEVGYHFMIGAGKILEARPMKYAGAHAGKDSPYNPTSIGIMLVGNYESYKEASNIKKTTTKKNKKDYLSPTPEDYEALVKLVTLLKANYEISSNQIYGHGSPPNMSVHPGTTLCPGKGLHTIIEKLRALDS